MKILVTGAAGMLGRKVVQAFAPDHEVIATARNASAGIGACDITRLADVRRVMAAIRPDVVVNTAAYTAVDLAESNAEAAYAVNAIGPRNLAIATEEAGAALLHVSTDYVFDGEKPDAYVEYDSPNPTSVYARSKFGGEEAVRQFSRRSYICRTQWLYGEGGKSFPETILRLANERPKLRIVDDQTGRPTYTGDVARQLKRIVEGGEYGLYHVAAHGTTTWFRFAKAILAEAGKRDFLVEPITTPEYPTPAKRPMNSALRNLNLELTIGDTMPDWERGLTEFMRRRTAPPA